MKRIVPGGVGFDHGIEHGQELAHAGNQRDLGQFAGCFETLMEGLDSRVVAGCSERRHVQHAANFKAPALHTSSSLARARIASDRGNAHECRNLATIELAQFRQLSNQAGTGYLADAASRLQQSVEFTKVFANVADHLTIDVVELGLNGGDDGLQTGGQTLGRALQPLSPGLNIQPGLSSWTKRRHVAMYEGSKLSDRRPRSGSGPPDDR